MSEPKRDLLIEASIYLIGGDLDPVNLTQVLGVEPFLSQKKGEPKNKSKPFIAKIGLWQISAKSECRSVCELVDEVLSKFADRADLDKLEGVQDAHLDLLFATGDEHETKTIEFRLRQDQIDAMSKLGLGLCVTMMGE